MLAHVPSFGRNPRGSPDFLAYPVPKACMHVLGTRVPRRLGVARSASSPKAAQAPVSGSRLAGSLAWHGLPQCPGCGHWLSYCCAAFVFGSGSRLGVGFVNPASPGWGLGLVCLGTDFGVVPLVSAVCGVRGWGSVSACFWDVCGCVGTPLAPRRFRFWRAVWACVVGPGLGCAQPFLAGLSGCVFCAFVFLFFLLGVPVPGPVVPVPPSPFFRAGFLALFFFSWCVSACFGVPFPGGPLFLAWCCRFWLGDPPVPLWGSCLRCLLGGGLAASGGVGGRSGGCGPFFAPPPSPLCCFVFFGGGVCLFLPLPSLGWRTHWPAFSVVFRAAVVSCVLFGRVPAPWVGWAMYTVGSAPLLAGYGPGPTGRAAAPGSCLWLWVRGLALFVSFPLCGAGFNLLGGPPPLLPGTLWSRVWPAVLVRGVLVRGLPGCAVACFV